MRLQGLGKLIKIIHLIGLELATFLLIAQCLNHYVTIGLLTRYLIFKATLRTWDWLSL
jgi:hypothetical protein